MTQASYKRVMIKLSGEAFAGGNGFGIDPDVVHRIAGEIMECRGLGVQCGIVIGAGNFLRARSTSLHAIERTTADYMGMLASVLNCLALQSSLEALGVDTRVQSAIEIREVAEPYIRRRALRHLEKSRVVIFAAGTGNPFFTTDTTAALRAIEIGADALLKASTVDGIYDSDPATNKDANRISELSYMEFIARELRVMDTTAVTMCKEHNVPIHVFDMTTPGNIVRAVHGDRIGTVVH